MKKLYQRHLIAPKLGLPAFVQKEPEVKYAVMCIKIKFCRFVEFFQRICLTVLATVDEVPYSPNSSGVPILPSTADAAATAGFER
jgi:hypothetical protein